MSAPVYPEAPRFIPATLDLLLGWSTLVSVVTNGDRLTVASLSPPDEDGYWPVTDGHNCWRVRIGQMSLDPACEATRDGLIRRLSLPEWLRDTPGGTEPWISAGLVACSAAGIVPLNGHGKSVRRVPRTTRLAELNHNNLLAGYALRLDANTGALPWPGGPRLWKRQ